MVPKVSTFRGFTVRTNVCNNISKTTDLFVLSIACKFMESVECYTHYHCSKVSCHQFGWLSFSCPTNLIAPYLKCADDRE